MNEEQKYKNLYTYFLKFQNEEAIFYPVTIFGNKIKNLINEQKPINNHPNQSHNDVALCAWLRLQHDLSSHPSFP